MATEEQDNPFWRLDVQLFMTVAVVLVLQQFYACEH